jgi:hypothetical protein
VLVRNAASLIPESVVLLALCIGELWHPLRPCSIRPTDIDLTLLLLVPVDLDVVLVAKEFQA